MKSENEIREEILFLESQKNIFSEDFLNEIGMRMKFNGAEAIRYKNTKERKFVEEINEKIDILKWVLS